MGEANDRIDDIRPIRPMPRTILFTSAFASPQVGASPTLVKPTLVKVAAEVLAAAAFAASLGAGPL